LRLAYPGPSASRSHNKVLDGLGGPSRQEDVGQGQTQVWRGAVDGCTRTMECGVRCATVMTEMDAMDLRSPDNLTLPFFFFFFLLPSPTSLLA